jgi:hypothetical protein
MSSQNTVCNIVPVDSAFLNVFFFGSAVHRYFTDCHLDSGSEWLMLVLPPMTVYHGVLLFPVFVGVTSQWQVHTLPLSVLLSIHCTHWAQALEYPPFSITACTVG